jgi:hypothetical protein
MAHAPIRRPRCPARAGHGTLPAPAGIADRAADVELVAGGRARAQQRLPGRHLAHRGDADVQRALRGVAADQLDALRLGQREQAARKAFEKHLVGTRQRQRQREPQRLRAAGGQVAEVDRQRLVAQAIRRHGGQEMAAFHQHVAGHGQLHAGRRHEQRAVVADAQRRAPHRG